MQNNAIKIEGHVGQTKMPGIVRWLVKNGIVANEGRAYGLTLVLIILNIVGIAVLLGYVDIFRFFPGDIRVEIFSMRQLILENGLFVGLTRCWVNIFTVFVMLMGYLLGFMLSLWLSILVILSGVLAFIFLRRKKKSLNITPNHSESVETPGMIKWLIHNGIVKSIKGGQKALLAVIAFNILVTIILYSFDAGQYMLYLFSSEAVIMYHDNDFASQILSIWTIMESLISTTVGVVVAALWTLWLPLLIIAVAVISFVVFRRSRRVQKLA